MPPRAAAKVKHLTEEELAERWDLDIQTVRLRRKSGDVPRYLPLSESATKGTIRYRLVDVEAYEDGLLVDPKAKADATATA